MVYFLPFSKCLPRKLVFFYLLDNLMFPGGRAGCESRSQAAAVTARASHGARPPAAPQRAAPPGAWRSLSLRAEPSRGGGAESGGRGGGAGVCPAPCPGHRGPLASLRQLTRLAGWAGGSAARERWRGQVCRSSCSLLRSAAGVSSHSRHRRKEVPGSGESDESGSPEVTAVRASLGGRGVGGGRGNGERDE